MNYFYILEPGHGTKLYKNSTKEQNIRFKPTKKESLIFLTDLLILQGDKIDYASKFLKNSKELFRLVVPPSTEYMIINISKSPIKLIYSEDPNTHEVIYDPYLYDNEKQSDIDPDDFKNDHDVPNGYIDTLPKWYSVKYTYTDKNFIFIRPKLGISMQKHKERKELWEIGYGSPIIIVGNKTYYNVKKGDTFSVSIGELHGIINPTDDWVQIIERYEGKFDEQDIIRVFNPNNYTS